MLQVRNSLVYCGSPGIVQAFRKICIMGYTILKVKEGLATAGKLSARDKKHEY